MKLHALEWQNAASYGNKIQRLEFNTPGQLILVRGPNGSGKCLSKDSEIFINIENEDVRNKFLEFITKNGKKPLYPVFYMIRCTIKDLYDFNQLTGLVDDCFFEVQTMDGFRKIETVDITERNSSKICLTTENNKTLKSSPNHLLFNNKEIKVSTLKIGDVIDTIDGKEKICSLIIDNNLEDLYDLQVVGREYIANGIRTHNSVIKQIIELCLFGKAQGKSGKKLSLKKLPNRRNKALYAGAWFETNGDDMCVKMYIEPNKLEVTRNGQDYTETYKVLSPKERDALIGFSYNVYKSFISLNINDFKNFISLSSDDKKNLLNKLFNIDELDLFLSITKEFDKANQKNIEIYENLIDNNSYQIKDYKNIIDSYQGGGRVERMTEIKSIMSVYKPEFDLLSTVINETDIKLKELSDRYREMVELKSQKTIELSNTQMNIEGINAKIEMFESGKCNMCETDLTDKDHVKHIAELEKERDRRQSEISKLKELLTRIAVEETASRNLNQQEYKKRTELNDKLNAMKIELGSLKKEYSYLKEQEGIEKKPIEEIELNLFSLIRKNAEYETMLATHKSKIKIYEELKALFSGDGIRKNMIRNIIKPINANLSVFLSKLESRYKAVLNDNFDASLYELETIEIDPETASKGEDRKINLAIALSYLKLILEKNYSNLLFLDEIFDGIDPDNVDVTLKILKEMAVEHQLSIICVHHGMNKLDQFDRIITVSRDIFSDIDDKNF